MVVDGGGESVHGAEEFFFHRLMYLERFFNTFSKKAFCCICFYMRELGFFFICGNFENYSLLYLLSFGRRR